MEGNVDVTVSHDRKETIRTVDSLIAIIIQLVSLGIQGYGLWWIMHHSH